MKSHEKLACLERKLGYQFIRKEFLIQALTHKSKSHQHNERLEFLGDALLNCIVASLLYQFYPQATEGELTRARAALVNQASLSEVANMFDLGSYLFLGIGELRSGGFRRASILADALEALIGAIYLDSNFESCFSCLERWLQAKMTNLLLSREKDPKTRLQEWLQASKKALPQYVLSAIAGEPHAQVFTVTCHIEALDLSAHGEGITRRNAEQQAASKIWEMIQQHVLAT